MRKITQEAFAAFCNGENLKRGNTEVITERDGESGKVTTTMLLHGSAIARKIGDHSVEITTAGWDTPTTKERLKPFASVWTKKFVLMLEDKPWDGDWVAI